MPRPWFRNGVAVFSASLGLALVLAAVQPPWNAGGLSAGRPDGTAWAKPPGLEPSDGHTTTWERFAAARRRQTEDDARALLGFAERSLDAQLDPLFARFEDGIDDFGAWSFRWRTSYALLRQGAVTAAAWPFSERQIPFGSSVRDAWDSLVVERFDALVLEPAGGTEAVSRIHRRWWEALQRMIDAATADTLLITSLFRNQPIAGVAAKARELPPEPLEGQFKPLATAPIELEERMARPLVARLAFRAPAAAGAGVVGEALAGVTDVAAMSGPTGLFLTVAGMLGIDYLLSWADEEVSRAAFEEDMRRLLVRAKTELRDRWLEQASEEISRRFDPVQAALTGQAGAAPVAAAP